MFLPKKPGPREFVREQPNIPDEYAILCGLAIGYPDPTFPANNLRTKRSPIEHNVVFHDA
jgi:nitroreductase